MQAHPEYVRQMDNVLNTHLRHTFLFLGLTAVATMVALGFHKVLLTIVSDTTGSQWAGQVSESIELTLTYGLVISALLFLSIMVVPDSSYRGSASSASFNHEPTEPLWNRSRPRISPEDHDGGTLAGPCRGASHTPRA